ncbi:MAG: endonuclease/exonuclease/phosphatase family protein [Gemmatimonadaceae bacterium]
MRAAIHLRAAVVACAAAVGVAACRAPRGTAAADGPLRVLVYNIHAGKDAGGVDNLARVAAIVRESGADVALLQEVDVRTERSGRVDQVAELARLTGMHATFGKSLDFQGGEYGIAVLSRWPVASREVIPLVTDPLPTRSNGAREPRVAVRAALRAPGGTLALMNTHIDASREESFRLQEAARLVAASRDTSPGGPRVALAGGDLNSEPESRTQAVLREGGWRDLWPECGAGDGRSYPARAPTKRIDYLYAVADVRCDRAEVLATEASDHRPVLFTIRIRR